MTIRLKHLLSSLIPLLFLLLLLWPAFMQAAPAGQSPSLPLSEQTAAKIDPPLLEAMAAAAADEPLRFIVTFPQQADLTQLPEGATAVARRAYIIQQLQTTAVAAQAATITQLETMQQDGRIHTYRPLWIINAIAATGTADAIHSLAANPDVAEIRLDAVVDRVKPAADAAADDPKLTLLQEGSGPLAAPESGFPLPWGIRRVNTPHAWYGLGINGSGVTVGIMDTGVDYQHPILLDNYRGNLGGGVFNHSGNWYNAVLPTITVPVDNFGHGTHVAGTAVGGNGFGVAPGARWIAVNIATPYGLIYASDAHAGFEWLLAPANNPALAPDIVNGSWGGDGGNIEFLLDINLLLSAGILPVFSAGNMGPFTATVGAPGSYPGVLTVGASDDIDEVAWFSSLGPSPLTSEIKPWLVAPGTQTLSSLPGGLYGYYNGTSMAAPHVSGAAALLLSANPTLSIAQIRQRLAGTAVPIAPAHPNMDSGWGRLDVYAAVRPNAPHGRLTGNVTSNGQPVPLTTITITTPGGEALPYQTDAGGMYEAWLQPGVYAISVSLFGHQPYQASGLVVSLDQTTTRHISLAPLPTGTVTGLIVDSQTQTPLPGVLVQVRNTPVTAVTGSDGRYTLNLPAGTYALVARADHYRLGQSTVNVVVGSSVTRNFSLLPGPMTLLVDTGQWYFESQAAYYQAALENLSYAYDTLTVRHPLYDVPTDDVMAAYDQVVWAAPRDSPGVLGANNVITNYLGQGGNLFISGQRVGQFDGHGFTSQLWWYDDLNASFQGKAPVTHTITGVPNTIFAGLSLTLNGGSSANNQVLADTAVPMYRALSRQTLSFPDGRGAGMASDLCKPGRIVYLGFGLEGVSTAVNRQTLLERSFTYFTTPRQQFGLRWLPDRVDDFAVPGDHMVYTLTVQNLSETLTDTFSLTAVPSLWSSSLVTTTLTLGPCQRGQTVLHLDIPANTPKDFYHTTIVTAVSGNNPATSNHTILSHKTPGQILFVDDDRWYDEDIRLTNALDAMGLAYDVWDTGWKDVERRGPPPAHLLLEYDFIVWYTGYDWFAPILPQERDALTAYLARGGRLFLTSQDFLYYHHKTPLAREYLGVWDYRESVTPTQAFGSNSPFIGADLAGPLPLTRGSYLNNGDGLILTPASQPFFWHDSGMPAGVAKAGPTWRSVFWAIPFEWLPDDQEAATMNRIMGWLGDLGDSTFEVDARAGASTAVRTYTITLRNTTLAPLNQVQMVNALPPELALLPGSIQGGAVYEAGPNRLTWQGSIAPGGARQIVYQAMPAAGLTPGTAVTNSLTIHYNRHNLTFQRTAVFWIDAPDLSASTFTAVPNRPQSATQVAYLLTVRNGGLAATGVISANMRLPDDLTVWSGTLRATGGQTWLEGHRVYWQGSLLPGQEVMVRIVTSRPADNTYQDAWLPATAVLLDGVTGTVLKEQILHLPAHKQYLPLMFKN
ncbi:MAG: S8 family serine peptidase [Chloroflexi bacterium]|nr:S8 family serine peptidase [Ardenticatenaceae bacterium]MBL1131147.1 DUF11 domain-containing protein [Chloroflexota bacterium]NOG37246.1 S8 family serine peptidase [Chloroflexota bacterium]